VWELETFRTFLLENVDSESAEELLEEGQAFEAGIISGVEGAPDADKSEVTTHGGSARQCSRRV
jgi:hypothetical protein